MSKKIKISSFIVSIALLIMTISTLSVSAFENGENSNSIVNSNIITSMPNSTSISVATSIPSSSISSEVNSTISSTSITSSSSEVISSSSSEVVSSSISSSSEAESTSIAASSSSETTAQLPQIQNFSLAGLNSENYTLIPYVTGKSGEVPMTTALGGAANPVGTNNTFNSFTIPYFTTEAFPQNKIFSHWEIEQNGVRVPAVFPLTISENTNIYAAYQDAYTVSFRQSEPTISNGKSYVKVYYTISVANIPGLQVSTQYYDPAIKNFQTVIINPGETAEILSYGWKQPDTTVLATITSTYDGKTYYDNVYNKYTVQGVSTYFDYQYYDLEGQLHDIQVTENTTNWMPLTSIQSLGGTGTPTISSDGNRALWGWWGDPHPLGGSPRLVMPGTSAQHDGAILTPIESYKIIANYPAPVYENGNLVYENGRIVFEDTTTESFTFFDQVLEIQRFNVNEIPFTAYGYTYEWKDQTGKVWGMDELAAHEITEPMILTGTITRDTNPEDNDLELFIQELWTPGINLDTRNSALQDEILAKLQENSRYASATNLQITEHASISNVINTANPTGQVQSVDEIGYNTATFTFDYVQNGETIKVEGKVNLMLVPQPVAVDAINSHWIARGDDSLINASNIYPNGFLTNIVYGVTSTEPPSLQRFYSEFFGKYFQENFPEGNYPATGTEIDLTNYIKLVPTTNLLSVEPHDISTGGYRLRDYLALDFSDEMRPNYYLLPFLAESSFGVVGYEGFTIEKVYDGEIVEVFNDDSRFNISSTLNSHILSFENAGVFNSSVASTSSDANTYNLLFKMTTESSSNEALTSEEGAAAVNVIIHKRPIVISGLDLNAIAPAADDYIVEGYGQDRGLLPGHTVNQVTMAVNGLTYSINDAIILDERGNDVTENYEIIYEPGTLIEGSSSSSSTPDSSSSSSSSTTNEIIPTPTPTTVPTTPITPVVLVDAGLAGPLAPVVAPLIPDALVLDLADAEIPLAGLEETEVSIGDLNIPLAAADGSWSLLDLLLTVGTSLLCIFLLIGYFKNKKKDEDEDEDKNEDEGEEEEKLKRKGIFRIFSTIPLIGSVILFLLTQDMRLPMVLVDRWTIIFAVIFIIQLVLMLLSKKSFKNNEEEESEEE